MNERKREGGREEGGERDGERILAATTAFAPIVIDDKEEGGDRIYRYELIKMAVHQSQRGKGLGKTLIRYVLNHLNSEVAARSGNGKGKGALILESSTKLGAALALYKNHGFVTTHQRYLEDESATVSVFPSPYATADIMMKCSLEPATYTPYSMTA